MSLRFPDFSLEREERAGTTAPDLPLVLTWRDGPRERVGAANRPARRLGIRGGQTLSAARALASSLEVRPWNAEGDRRLLERLAGIFMRYSPDLAFDPYARGAALLVEVQRTAGHFGGEVSLVRDARALARRLGHRPVIAVAPRPAAASALAAGLPIRSAPLLVPEDELAPRLDDLPCAVLDVEPRQSLALKLLGIGTLGELRALPRQGLAHRLGEEIPERLALIYGERQEPLPRLRPAAVFRESIEWWPPRLDIGPLLFAGKRLFDLAQAELESRQEGLVEARMRIRFPELRETREWPIRPSRPLQDASALLRLFQDRLEAGGLPGAADRLELLFTRRESLQAEQGELFAAAGGPCLADEAVLLLDHLAARLGAERVRRSRLQADHRPEKAWREAAAGANETGTPVDPPSGRRPFFLEPRPIPIRVETDDFGNPTALLSSEDRGPILARSGPERICGGWWDGQDVRRRYYEVECSSAAHLWIFQDLDTGFWFRHGLFA